MGFSKDVSIKLKNGKSIDGHLEGDLKHWTFSSVNHHFCKLYPSGEFSNFTLYAGPDMPEYTDIFNKVCDAIDRITEEQIQKQ